MSESKRLLKPAIPRKLLLVTTLIWVLLALAGFIAVQQLVADDYQRDAQYWQRQLQLTTESQRRQVEQWLKVQQSVITGLANNTSLKLYITELRETETDEVDHDFTSFLTSLLISEAQQHGFYEPRITESVPANIPAPIGAGLAILNQHGVAIVSTAGMPTLAQLPKPIRKAFRARTTSPIGPFLLKEDKAYLLFFSPISPIQSDSREVQGYIVGIKAMDEDVSDLLALPPQAAASSESLLVRKQGKAVQYLTSLKDGTKPLALTLDYATLDLAAAYAVKHPGQFMQKRDYQGQKVIAASQPIANTDWTLLHKVNAKVAFAAATKRGQSWLAGYVLMAGLITVVGIAIWRNISARRARQIAEHYQQLSDAAEKQKSLLSHLTNTLIMLVDSRDPHAQHHSNGVAMIASAIAEHMNLPSDMQETTTLAASLMNVGKIKMPATLLSEKDLSAEDKAHIRESMLASADMLKHIEFSGPVVDTLKQALEHVDGSGPLGLKGDDILISAKIIAVANAFVAMVSDRAYRKAMSIEAALDEVHKGADSIYARPVVAALEHYIINGGGRESWARITASQSK